MKESFSELYARLYSENFQDLEKLRAKHKKSWTIALIALAVVFIVALNPLMMMFFTFTIPILVIVFAVFLVIKSIKQKNDGIKIQTREKTYAEMFKEKVVGPIIENTFEAAKYDPKAGISRYEYNKGRYKEDIDRFSSDDLIIAPLKVNNDISTFITFSEVHTERETRDDDGNISYVTVFHGIAANFLIPKNIGKSIYIRNNGRVSGWNNNKIKMDMSEFEKIFDVESDDPILTMRILTSDVMTQMIDLYKKYKYKFEISIINDNVYMRLRTGPMFEPNIFKSSMEYKTIEKYYLVLKALTGIAENIYDTISRLEI